MARFRSTFGRLMEEAEAEGSDAILFILAGQREQESLKLAEISLRLNKKTEQNNQAW